MNVPQNFVDRFVAIEQLLQGRDDRHSTAGAAKVLEGAGASQPSATLNDGNVLAVTYTSPLVFDGLVWPDTMRADDGSAPDESDVYAGGRFYEQPQIGQVHLWRVLVNITKVTNAVGVLIFTLENPESGFVCRQLVPIDHGYASLGGVMAQFITVATPLSVVPPVGTGNGYTMEIEYQHGSGTDGVTVTVDSVTVIYQAT